MIQQTRVPEIAIVGGGPSGLALAGMLERAGMDFVLYERGSRDEAPRGGCLDLHKGSGQRAMKEAGCWAEMEKYGRRGDATVHWVFDHLGNRFASWGEGHDAPELDRYDIKRALLTTVPDAKIQWDSHMTEANRDGKGQVILRFADGSTASGFKLVVGADGAWSKIRHLVCLLFCAENATFMDQVADSIVGHTSSATVCEKNISEQQNPRRQSVL